MISATTKYRFQKFLFITLFWIFSSIFYVLIRGEIIPESDNSGAFHISILLVCFGGLLLGFTTAFLEIFIFPKLVKHKSFGYSIRIKAFIFALLILSVTLLIGLLYGKGTGIETQEAVMQVTGFFKSKDFLTLVFYLMVCSTIVDFILQMNRKFGPGMLWKLLNGRYYHPKEESRIFMFLDLHDSTHIAETLGHVRFSYFLQDCFKDLSEIILKYEADIYQFVGDEAVLTWLDYEGLRNANCLKIYFEYEALLEKRRHLYFQKYGFHPLFKASLNMGKVTAAEVGDIKSEIAFHGDVLNTAARVQKLCGVYNKNLLLTEPVADALSPFSNIQTQLIETVSLKGKNKRVNVYTASIYELSY